MEPFQRVAAGRTARQLLGDLGDSAEPMDAWTALSGGLVGQPAHHLRGLLDAAGGSRQNDDRPAA
jgi:hypothetical protein